MAEAERRLAAIGCDKVNLLIEPDNAGVERFYRRLGYDRDELIFMEKWLAAAGYWADRPGIPTGPPCWRCRRRSVERRGRGVSVSECVSRCRPDHSIRIAQQYIERMLLN